SGANALSGSPKKRNSAPKNRVPMFMETRSSLRRGHHGFCRRRGRSLLPADYCQLELRFDVPRTRTELVWKSDISFRDKALGLKATVAELIHYCQLDWMKALQHRWVGTIPHDR